MASSILKEIEELHAFLERKDYEPYQSLSSTHQQSPAPQTVPAPIPAHPNASINTAERSVDKLGIAIEAAEQEMEAALRRTTEVHKSQLRQKEMELSELQRQLVAKDRCIDGLRDTLSTTKRTYEGRLAQLEEALGTKTAKVAELTQELRVAATARQAAETHLDRAAALHEQDVAHQRARQAQKVEQQRVMYEQQIADLQAVNAELSQTARARADEAARAQLARADEVARAQAAVNAERAELSRASRDVLELRRQVEALNDKLLVARVEGRTEREQLAVKVEDLKRRLKSERGLRKSCEKWMRSELKSREEMELLLGVVKDAAGKDGHNPLGKHRPALTSFAQEDTEVRDLLARMSRMAAAGSASPSPTKPALLNSSQPLQSGMDHLGRTPSTRPDQRPMNGSPPAYTPHGQVAELSELHRQAAEDNQRLRAELAVSKRLMAERLRGF